VHAESATGICGLLPYTCGLMSLWAFVLGDSVLGAFVRIPGPSYRIGIEAQAMKPLCPPLYNVLQYYYTVGHKKGATCCRFSDSPRT